MSAHISLLADLIRTEESFFRSAFRSSAPISYVAQFMSMRTELYGLIRTLTAPAEDVAPDQLHIHIPAGWGEPVPVQATNDQINSTLVDIPESRELASCAICQEAVPRSGVELRTCHHQFHGTCIREWFTQSVRCPVCRNDIREGSMEES